MIIKKIQMQNIYGLSLTKTLYLTFLQQNMDSFVGLLPMICEGMVVNNV